MMTCSKSVLRGETWADVVEYAIKLSDELTVCNQRILAIKDFVERQENSLTQNNKVRGEGSDKAHAEARSEPERNHNEMKREKP